MAEKFDAYQEITDRMIAALEKGTVPWRTPWIGGSPPMRMSANKPYEGINVFILGLTAASKGYRSPWWGTYGQIAEKAGMKKGVGRNGLTFWYSPDGTARGVRQGEHGVDVTLWKQYPHKTGETDPETGKPEIEYRRVLRLYRVFNADQAEGLPERYHPEPGEFTEHADAQAILDGYFGREDAPKVFHDQAGRAFYRCDGSDEIHLPPRESFKSTGGYYSTAFHEAGHSTGWETRLDRPGVRGFDHFGSGKYAKEELVAEMTAVFLDAQCGIDGEFDNSAAYIASWLKALQNDKRLVISAAGQAQKAVHLITGAEPEKYEEANGNGGHAVPAPAAA